MKKLAAAITNLMLEVTPESYYEINLADPVKYPYMTYTYNADGIDGNQEGFNITLNLFDYSTSPAGLLQLEEDVRTIVHKRRAFTDDLFLQYRILGSSAVPTGEAKLKRRDIRIFCKTDWRNKKWQ